MNAAVIKIKDAKRPGQGKKQATIHTDDGQTFGVWPDKFGLLQPGRTYRVEFSEREYNGKTYRTITKCEPVETPQGSTGGASGEAEFVARCLAASIQACAVGHKQEDLLTEARMLRTVYRQTFASS